MENDKLIKKSAYVVGIATLSGFLILIFMPTSYINPFAPCLVLFNIMLSPVGILEAFILGKFAYFIFKRTKKSLLIYWVIFCFFVLGGFWIGFSSLGFILRATSKTPPYENRIDTNQDGKIDKWIYHNDMSTRVEIDTDFDGKPDIREYYENGELIRKEKVTDYLKK